MEAPISASQGAMRSLPGKLKSLLSEPENRLQKGVKNKIGTLKGDLEELIDKYLLEPSEVEAPALTASSWMKEVRELSYDIYDFVDELDTRAKIQKSPPLKISRFRKKLKRRQEITDEISRFRTRVKEAIQQHKDHLDNLKRWPSSSAAALDERLLPPLHGEADLRLVGMGSSIEELSGWLANDGKPERKVASIVGIGGVGKTTLANELYRKLGGQFQCRAFVRTTRKSDQRRLLISILSQVRPHEPLDAWGVPNLVKEIKEYLKDKTYFIIIDDLWAPSTWDIVNRALPKGNHCTRILTTTEVEVVARICCAGNSKYIFKKEPLREDQSKELFSNRISVHQSDKSPKDLSEVPEEFINEIGGLPLAIIIMASLLACQPASIQQWNYIKNLPSSSLIKNTNLEGMKQVLNLSYNSLPHYLKTCMLYLSLYEEDNIIWKDGLVKQWISEGFICAMEGKDKEGVAQSYFDELVHRGMIQPVDISSNDEVLSCTVHYMVLHFIRYKSIEENFITAIDHSQTAVRLADKVRRLALHFGDAEDATPPTRMRLSQVRSLAFSGLFKCMPSIVEFQFLRVLILKLWVAPDEMSYCNLTGISELFRLRYLHIDACHVSVELPAQMQWLKDLIALEIEAKVTAVPPDIVDIPGMLYLGVPSEAHLPTGIGRMTSLRTLGYFDLSRNSEDNVMDLGKLTNLQNLHLTCSTAQPTDNLKKNMKCLGLILEKLSNLKSVTLAPAGSSHVTLYDVSASSMMVSLPPALLQRLELSRRCCVLSSLPDWIGKLGKLGILKIAVGVLSISDIDILKGLPALTALSLYVRTYPAGRIAFYNKGFPVLKYFKFMCAAPCLAFLEGALPSVQKLKLGFNANRVDQHSLVATGLEYLADLKKITAKIGCSGADASATRAAESAFLAAINKHPSTLIIVVQCVDLIQEKEHCVPQKQQEIHDEGVSGVNSRKTPRIYDEDDRGTAPEEQEHSALEKQEEIQEVISGLNTGKTTRISYGEEDRSTEQDHSALEKQQEIQEEGVSGVNTRQKTRISHGEASKGASMEEQVDITREEQHEHMKKSPEHSKEHVYKLSRRVMSIGHVSADLAMAAMRPLLPKLAELLNGAYKLQNSVKEDLESIERELRSINTTLHRVAESPLAQLWANDVRKLSYNLEDAVDNFLVRVDWSKPSVNPNSFSGRMNKMSSLFRKVRARHQIADVIKGIKYQVEDLATRRGRCGLDEVVANLPVRTIDPRLSALYKDEKEIVGIQLARDELIKRLIDGNDDLSKQPIKTVSIFGFAGLGKTTLARAVYDRLQSKFVHRAFVSVGQNPKVNQIFMDILFQLDTQKYCEAFNLKTLDQIQLIDELQGVLKNKRYIIVIDDIWDVQCWDIIKCACIDSNCGSRIITTTRNFEVAAKAGEVYNLKPLSRDSSEELLCTRLFGRKGNCPYDQPTELFEKVLRKCGGVPLAIITIATLLAGKPMEDWSKVYNCTGFGNEDNEYVNLRRVMLSSYYDLPSFLRICLLHLSIYPKDYEIEKETLIWKWIAEGFVHESPDIGLYAVGESYFNELINRSMIQPVKRRNGIVYACRVNWMVLDMICSLTGDEILVVVLEDNKQHTSGHKNARRLAIENSVLKRNNPLSIMCTPQMRSFNATMCYFRLMPPLSNFCALRVLSMEDCTFKRDSSSYHLRHLGRLHQLRYLGLCNSPINELPEEIGDLKFLQTLDLRYTLIKELRQSVGLLRQLKCLRVDGVSIRVPEWIGNLTSLEELSLDTESNSLNFIEELRNLTGLRKLKFATPGFDLSLMEDLVRSLSNLKNIQDLEVSGPWIGEDPYWEDFVPPRQLRFLHLLFGISRLPRWFYNSSLPELSHLFLDVKAVEQQDVEILGSLPELLSLTLFTPDVFLDVMGDESFPKLMYCKTHATLRFLEGAMPRLESLEFRVQAPTMKDADFDIDFGSLRNLPYLQEVTVVIVCTRVPDTYGLEVALRHATDTHPNCPILYVSNRKVDPL